MPIQIAGAIFQYAKLRMLQFYYDFLIKYVDRTDFQMMYMDTDSMYMAITEDKFDKIIKPEMKEEYEEIKTQWFPQNAYDMRTMGLFKVEYEGDGMICLAPKLYYCLGDKNKYSCKGTQKKNNINITTFDNYKKCLDTNKSIEVENTGMRYINGGVCWYSQTKTGLSCKYNKRHLMEDRITTYP